MSDNVEYSNHLKIQDIGFDSEGSYLLEVDLEAIHLSRAGLVHGGMIFSMLDAALGRASIAQLPEGFACPTVEMKINYFRPVATGKIRAKGRVVNKSKQLCYAEGEVLSEEGKLIARSTGTFFIKQL